MEVHMAFVSQLNCKIQVDDNVNQSSYDLRLYKVSSQEPEVGQYSLYVSSSHSIFLLSRNVFSPSRMSFR